MDTMEKSKDQQMTEDYNASIIETLQEIETKARAEVVNDEDYEQSAWSLWLDDVLEIVTLGRKSNHGKWEIHGVEVLISFGGPTTRATFTSGSEWITVTTGWGGVVSQEVYLPLLAAELEQYAENQEIN